MIFVDSSFWIALMILRDDHHDEALRLVQRHGTEPLMTTTHVRGETWTIMRRRVGFRAGATFLRDLAASAHLTVFHPSDEVERDALAWMESRGERPYSHVDAVSVAVMRSLGVRRALTFDEDFAVAGFDVLRA